MDIQARIPPALAAIHNFIRQHDPDEIQQFGDDDEDEGACCLLARDEDIGGGELGVP